MIWSFILLLVRELVVNQLISEIV